MRRLLAVGAAALLAVTGTALAQDLLDPKVRYNAADQARARAALVVQRDLGAGWQGGTSAAASSLKAPICPQLRPDYSKLTLTGHAESVFDNGNGGVQVVSDVEVWRTERQAAQHMNALLKPALPKCIRYSFLKTPGGDQLAFFPVKKTKLPKLGDSSVAYRAPVGYKVGNQTVVVTSDFIFLRKGRTEIYINLVGPSTNDKQLTALGTRLARTLIGRVRG
jgi:hypothetical protein